MKLKAKKEELILYVETAHYRKNEPYNAQLRKETRRFMLILGDMLKEDFRSKSFQQALPESGLRHSIPFRQSVLHARYLAPV